MSNPQPKVTPLHPWHVAAGGKIVDFSGWQMPVNYAGGIIHEHLETRRSAGMFDVSHMGRFAISGPDALKFLRYALTNDAALLAKNTSQYTIIPDEDGCAVDDCYLYRWRADEYLLVVNAANTQKDWSYLQALAGTSDVHITDRTAETVMIAVQGPRSAEMLGGLLSGELPAARRNALSTMQWHGQAVQVGRTGYTGEPVGFEIITGIEEGPELWRALSELGVEPVGLGARDTLRLEAGLPLYGHEFGIGPDGKPIPIFSSSLARFAVKLSPDREHSLGHPALLRQMVRAQGDVDDDPLYRIRPFVLTGKGIARAGTAVLRDGEPVGWVTSGTMVPYWLPPEQRESPRLTETGMRALGLALVDPSVVPGDTLQFVIRGREVEGQAVARNLDTRHPPYAIPVLP